MAAFFIGPGSRILARVCTLLKGDPMRLLPLLENYLCTL